MIKSSKLTTNTKPQRPAKLEALKKIRSLSLDFLDCEDNIVNDPNYYPFSDYYYPKTKNDTKLSKSIKTTKYGTSKTLYYINEEVDLKLNNKATKKSKVIAMPKSVTEEKYSF